MAVQDIYGAVVGFELDKVAGLVESEIAAGTPVEEILNEGLIAPMDEVGEKFSAGDLFIPEMLKAAKTMKAGLELLKPHLSAGQSQNKGTVVIGTVKGDLHDIGKNLVAMMAEGAGFEVIDLGVDVESGVFVKAAQDNGAQIVALSALLTTTMPAMGETIQAIKAAGLSVKTIIGGAPVTKAFAEKISAEGYEADAPGAVNLMKELTK